MLLLPGELISQPLPLLHIRVQIWIYRNSSPTSRVTANNNPQVCYAGNLAGQSVQNGKKQRDARYVQAALLYCSHVCNCLLRPDAGIGCNKCLSIPRSKTLPGWKSLGFHRKKVRA